MAVAWRGSNGWWIGRPSSSSSSRRRRRAIIPSHVQYTPHRQITKQEDQDLLLQAAAIPSEDDGGDRQQMPTPASDFAAAAAAVARGFQGTLRWVVGRALLRRLALGMGSADGVWSFIRQAGAAAPEAGDAEGAAQRPDRGAYVRVRPPSIMLVDPCADTLDRTS